MFWVLKHSPHRQAVYFFYKMFTIIVDFISYSILLFIVKIEDIQYYIKYLITVIGGYLLYRVYCDGNLCKYIFIADALLPRVAFKYKINL